MSRTVGELLGQLREFIFDEQRAQQESLADIWGRPLSAKRRYGLSQGFTRLEPLKDDARHILVWPDEGESRFREGDLLCLHGGDPLANFYCRRAQLLEERDERWLLRIGRGLSAWAHPYEGGPFYADPDLLDLTHYFERALSELESTDKGLDVLKLFTGSPVIEINEADQDRAEEAALAAGFNPRQAQAVGLALGAEQAASIQGPPGTGKTRVLAFIARLMVERHEKVLLTAASHMAINNALNKIRETGVPVVKVGDPAQVKGLDPEIKAVAELADWEERPERGGYVVGATPFATCNYRLEAYDFGSVIFDEASQMTAPLALMAMRKGRRFFFVGDHRQLPPVTLSRSILAAGELSAFRILAGRKSAHTVMLNETYRLNDQLADWPGRTYYQGRLRPAEANRRRRNRLARPPEPRLAGLFDPEHSLIFVPSGGQWAGPANRPDAELAADICRAALNGGLRPAEIGVVTPFRAQGRLIRGLLRRGPGAEAAGEIVADTVERMQGQERELVVFSLAVTDPARLALMAEFIFQPERLNVSVTRARTRLIIIGPPEPELDELEDERVRAGLGQYLDLVAHCRRVDIF